MSEKSKKLEHDEEQKIIAEITKELKAEGYSEEEVRQGLELAYHLKTNVKAKTNSLSDSCEH